MRHLGIFIAVALTGCFRNLDFAPCQEDPSQSICFDSGTVETSTDSATVDSESDASDSSTTEGGACTGASMQSCGKCGTQTRSCVAGTWSDWSTCTGEKECMPGEVTTGGTCPGALEKSAKKCNATCTYDPDVCALPKGWTPIAGAPAGFSGRILNSAVWTGGEMIVFGGGTSVDGEPGKKDGALYRLKTNSWEVLPVVTIVSYGRKFHTSVWTGDDMLVWGGVDNGTYLADGLTYSAYSKSWSKLPAAPLAARNAHVSVWVPSSKRMLIWGGSAGAPCFSDGAEYDPGTATWTKLPTAPISARTLASARWTGTEMLVWGGECGGTSFKDGALYNPMTKTWRAVPTSPIAGRRWAATGVFSPNLFIVFGGSDTAGNPLSDGAVANLGSTVTWTTLAAPPTPAIGGRLFTSNWNEGDSLAMWSGATADPLTGEPTLESDGAAYNPTTGVWSTITSTGAPLPRELASTVSTGSCGIVWSGVGKPGGGIFEPLTDGALYCP